MTTLTATMPSDLMRDSQIMSGWDVVELNRRTNRPQTQDFLKQIFFEVKELHGDRYAGDDQAIFTGFAMMRRPEIGVSKFYPRTRRCVVIGHRKGHDVEERKRFNFGYAHPEGYRKGMRMMRLAAKFGLPIVNFVDTAGAAADEEAERRGQSSAIAHILLEASKLRTQIVSVFIGEGGSGGALALSIADKIAILENAWFTVASPEACAAITYKVTNKENAAQCANSMKLRSWDNLDMGFVDEVLLEPLGGAHLDYSATAATVHAWLYKAVCDLQKMSIEKLLDFRYRRFRNHGVFT